MFDIIIYIEIGLAGTRFGIHRGLLCEYSAYFRAALLGNFPEATEGVVRLPDEEVEVFELVNGWLYTQTIPDMLEAGVETLSCLLVELYIFGERTAMPKLQNDTIDAIIRTTTRQLLINTKVIPRAYEETPKSSPLRKLLVDIFALTFAEEGGGGWENMPELLPEFLLDVIMEMRLSFQPSTMWFDPSNRSRYHISEAT